jgi:cell division transport system ATP-binding protein
MDYRNVQISQGGRQVLRDVNFTMGQGELCFIVGRSGSGKTSLLRSAYGDIDISGDRAQVVDVDMLTLRREERYSLKRQLGIVFQDFKLFEDWSVARNLAFVLFATDWTDRSEVEQRIEEVLASVGLGDKREAMVSHLSGGEQQRLSIARAILNKPRLIVADEPTGSLDHQTANEILKVLMRVAADHQTAILLATHNQQLIERYGARVLRCEDGLLKEMR